MKKSIITTGIILFLILTQISCSKKSYDEYRAFPVQYSLKIHPGQSSFIAVRFEIPDGQYIYGNPKGPGIGKETKINIEGNSGLIFQPARYLTPVKNSNPNDSTDFTWVYKNETTIFIPVTAKKNLKEGTYDISIHIDALLCSNSSCVAKEEDIPYTVHITTTDIPTAQPSDLVNIFKSSKSPSDTMSGNMEEFINSTQISDTSLQNINFEPRVLDEGVGNLIQAILFGLLAGFILNFMPCVLPVVSLKVMGFVRLAGEEKGKLRMLGIIFSLGILTSFAVLAVLAAFLGYNWGGLFQHQMFIVIMAAIIFALALSMFEVFTINAPTFAGKAAMEKNNPYLDAYVKGVLATLLATPCSGPFLGGTLAWALTQSPLVIVTIFMSIGIGMALPYFALTLNPRFISFIPKPGQWMQTFERIMAFLLVFTVIYLIGILDAVTIMPTVAFLGFIALGFWQFGTYGSIIQSRIRRIISAFILIIIVVGGFLFSFHYLYSEDEIDEFQSTSYSIERIMKNKDNNKVSMVIFTADWCPNCTLVESMSLHTENVTRRVRVNNIDVMIADITSKNAMANILLKKLGSKSIPFLALFPPGKGFKEPICMRDMYSEEDVLKGINMALKGVNGSRMESDNYKFQFKTND